MHLSRFEIGHNSCPVFFNHETQSFVVPLTQWSQFLLCELSQDVSLGALAKDIHVTQGIAEEKAAEDIRSIVGDAEAQTIEPEQLNNQSIFDAAAMDLALECSISLYRCVGDQQISIGFSNKSNSKRFQKIMNQAFVETEQPNRCDVLLDEYAMGYRVLTADGVVDDELTFEQASLFSYNSAEDIAAKRSGALFLAHAGAVACKQSNAAAIIPALGKAGKSTLSLALALNNYYLINDDVVPVMSNGNLYSLGQSVKLREGSWNLFGDGLTKYSISDPLSNGDDLVKVVDNLPSNGNEKRLEFPCKYLIVPEYSKHSEPLIESITAKDALGALVKAESIFRKPASDDQLKNIIDWVTKLHAFRIRYNDVESGNAMVDEVFGSSLT